MTYQGIRKLFFSSKNSTKKTEIGLVLFKGKVFLSFYQRRKKEIRWLVYRGKAFCLFIKKEKWITGFLLYRGLAFCLFIKKEKEKVGYYWIGVWRKCGCLKAIPSHRSGGLYEAKPPPDQYKALLMWNRTERTEIQNKKAKKQKKQKYKTQPCYLLWSKTAPRLT